MANTTGAGSKIYIGPANTSAATQTAFEALTYQEIGDVVNIGEFGITFESVTSDHLGDRFTKMFKGQKSGGSPTIVYDYDSADTGQSNAATALASDSDYAFKVELNDAGTGSPSSPSTFYFRAKVMGNRLAEIQPNNMVRRNLVLGINADPVEVEAV